LYGDSDADSDDEEGAAGQERECQALVQMQRTTAKALMRGSIRRCPTSVYLCLPLPLRAHPLSRSPAVLHPLHPRHTAGPSGHPRFLKKSTTARRGLVLRRNSSHSPTCARTLAVTSPSPARMWSRTPPHLQGSGRLSVSS
jgi:hypothetical protein